MKTHSREWFLQQIASAKRNVEEEWPSWMKEAKMVATASFPKIGETQHEGRRLGVSGSREKKKSL